MKSSGGIHLFPCFRDNIIVEAGDDMDVQEQHEDQIENFKRGFGLCSNI